MHLKTRTGTLIQSMIRVALCLLQVRENFSCESKLCVMGASKYCQKRVRFLVDAPWLSQSQEGVRVNEE